MCVRACVVCFCLYHPVDPLKLSGLLENDDIVVSRRANSYVLTSVGSAGNSSSAAGKKKLHNTKLRSNGLETMLKKAGAGNFNMFSASSTNCPFKIDDCKLCVCGHFYFISSSADGITVTAIRNRSQNLTSDAEKEADISFIPTSIHSILHNILLLLKLILSHLIEIVLKWTLLMFPVFLFSFFFC